MLQFLPVDKECVVSLHKKNTKNMLFPHLPGHQVVKRYGNYRKTLKMVGNGLYLLSLWFLLQSSCVSGKPGM